MPNKSEYNKHRTIIEVIVPQYWWSLVAAIIDRESAWNQTAYRRERGWLDRMPNGPRLEQNIREAGIFCEVDAIESSYGLMQIMHATAFELGCRRNPESLYLPEVNILWGWVYLRKQLQRYNAQPMSPNDTPLLNAIAAYNAGSARTTVDGKYTNQSYVDFVWNQMLEWRGVLK